MFELIDVIKCAGCRRSGGGGLRNRNRLTKRRIYLSPVAGSQTKQNPCSDGFVCHKPGRVEANAIVHSYDRSVVVRASNSGTRCLGWCKSNRAQCGGEPSRGEKRKYEALAGWMGTSERPRWPAEKSQAGWIKPMKQLWDNMAAWKTIETLCARGQSL